MKYSEEKPKFTRDYYIENIKVGNSVAFTMDTETGPLMLSGKVIKLEQGKEFVTVQTKNGSVFFPLKKSIVWVKNGVRWPMGIYNALKLGNKTH